MLLRVFASSIACIAGLAGAAATARADGTSFPGTRPLGTAGAMRAMATGDAGPMLNPSGISLIRSYQIEAGYQYDKAPDSHDARISAVDSTSAFNVGGALFYNYHSDNPAGVGKRTGYLAGGSLAFPIADKVFLGGSAKYLSFGGGTESSRTGLTFDAGLTLRLVQSVSLGAVGYNLRDIGIDVAPRAFGGGVAILPVPALLLVFDSVLQDVRGGDSAVFYMGGVEYSYASAAAIRAGGGRDGITKHGYFSLGVSGLSANIGSIDLGFRQDVSGTNKAMTFAVSFRLFVPGM